MNDFPHVTIWGTGSPRREFLFVDDMAEASVFVMQLDKNTYKKHTEDMLSHINVGCGEDLTIASLAKTIREIVGYSGEIDFDENKLDGTPRKLLDCSRVNALGWQAKTRLEDGLKVTYEDFLKNANL
jgi:GDP-L-fucose synthase